MSGTAAAGLVARPVFAEGQILGAADLAALSDYARGRAERHDRCRHRTGVVTGLTLDFSEKPRLFVQPGIAVDALGREIVVPERVELDAISFRLVLGGGADADTFYPVLLTSIFRPAQPEGGRWKSCGGAGGAARIEETVQIRFGRAGDEMLLESVAVGDLMAAPSPAEGAGPPLLLGFVRWDPALGQFADVADASPSAARQQGGVNAAVLAGTEGSVLVQPRPAAPAGVLVLELKEKNGLRFGRIQAPGRIESLFSVDDAGNVTAAGTLTGRPARGTVLVSSGQASDGLVLPLPPGVTEDQVARGDVAAQVIVAPHVDPTLVPDPAREWTVTVQECWVDEDRRLCCRLLWMSVDFGGGAQGMTVVAGPGLADYLVVCTTASGARP